MDGPFFFDRRALEARAKALRASFESATPFPYAVVDGLVPGNVADRLAEAFPGPEVPGFKRVEHREQAGRLGHLQRKGFEGVAPEVRHFLNELNGQAFVDFLQELTGVEGLIPDPHFRGAGLQLTLPGGHLSLHADYNRDRFRQLERRLTCLFYVNPGWDPLWGGELELWPADLSACAVRIPPQHNRLVVMVHRSDSWHGNPTPLRCPEGRVRRAVAAYYYTVDRPDDEKRPAHPAIWVEPGKKP